MERSKNGIARPIFYKGEQVGEWRHYDERLTMFLLRFRRRHRFGPEADILPRPPADIPGYEPDEEIPFDPEAELGGSLDESSSRPSRRPRRATAWPSEPRRAMRSRRPHAYAHVRARAHVSLPTLPTFAWSSRAEAELPS